MARATPIWRGVPHSRTTRWPEIVSISPCAASGSMRAPSEKRAVASLKERLRKQQLAAQALAARVDPTTRALTGQAFDDLPDPRGRFHHMSPPRRPRPPGSPTSVRLTTEILKRVDRLLPKLERDPERRALGKITRSKAIRLAIVRGLDALEGELAR